MARRSVSGGPSPALAVRARGITKTFGDVVALDGVDLDVDAGQVHGLVGPNGAGKTTLLGMLLGLVQADGGELEIFGNAVGRALALPDGVAGFVDGPGLYPSLTARQNLTAFARLRGAGGGAVADVLHQVGLAAVADDRVRGFSLGMRQRLGLAAALLTRPRLLVLDEPANGLDPAGTRQVHEVLSRLAAGGTAIVISSHRMDELAALCSEVTLLATGRVMFSGPLTELVDETDELDYRLRTSDAAVARRVAESAQRVRVLGGDSLPGRAAGSEELLVRATVSALDELVRRLVTAGVGVRELSPVVAPLEAAFHALTKAAGAGRRGMTTNAAAAAVTLPAAEARPAAVMRGYRFELLKLIARWPIRLALLACWLGPGLLVAVVSRQSSLPSDTLFGRWMGQSGWAGPLVVLTFCGSWVLPLLTSLIAGDVFAHEDRLGTWRHLLVAVRSPRRIFAAKALASLTLITALVTGLATSGIVGGLAAVGNRPLVGMDGHLLAPGQAAGAVLLAWGSALAPTLAFAGIGLLGSVALGRSPMGLTIPAVLAFLLQVVQLLPLPVAVRVVLPSYAFVAWRGLFTSPAQSGPLIVGIVVNLALATAAVVLAYLLFMRRDFTDLTYDGAGRRALVRAVLPLVALLALAVGVIAATAAPTGSGIDRAKLDRSLRTAFAHLYRMQTRELHRPAVTETEMRTGASCDKGGSLVADVGPGNDWRCVVTWHLSGTAAIGAAIYELDVSPDGRYVADGDGPQGVNGFFQLHTATGDVQNPLWQFDGSIDLLSTA